MTGTPAIYRFGDFELDPQRRLLRTGDGRHIALTARVLDLALVLVARRGQIVDKETLLRTVWPNVFVEENNLTQAVSTLRRALGEGPRDHRYIATVPGRGYTFVADVEEVPREARQPAGTGTDRIGGEREAGAKRNTRIAGLGAAATLAVLVILLAWTDRGESPDEGGIRLTDLHLVSNFPGDHTAPALSPDGSLVAFVSDATGTPQIWVASIRRGEPLQLTRDPAGAGHPAWSPRGDEILFHSRRGGIWSVGPLGTPAPHPVTTEGWNPSLAAGAGTIVYEVGREIRVANADGSNQRTVTGLPEQDQAFMPMYPALSPDGGSIVFFLQESGPFGDLWVIPTAGGAARQLTFDLTDTGKPVWTPDGRQVLYASKRGGTRSIWRVSISGGEPQPVTTGVGADGDPTIAADGRTLVYTNFRAKTRFLLTDPWTGRSDVLHESRNLSWFPRVSPDGEHIAFFAELPTREQVFVMRSDGTNVRQLTFGDGREVNVMPRWSPDSASVFFYATLISKTLRRVPLAGGPSEEVLSDFTWIRNTDFELSPDGRLASWVRVDHSSEYRRRGVVLNLDDGSTQLLDPAFLFTPTWSDDSDRLLGTGRDEILICPVAGEDCDRVIDGVSRLTGGGPAPFPGLLAQWSHDQSRIFFSRPATAPGMLELWVVDADGNNAGKLLDYGPVYVLAQRFDVMPDDSILWTHYDRGSTELWHATIED